jgi:hypothetical protein
MECGSIRDSHNFKQKQIRVGGLDFRELKRKFMPKRRSLSRFEESDQGLAMILYKYRHLLIFDLLQNLFTSPQVPKVSLFPLRGEKITAWEQILRTQT